MAPKWNAILRQIRLHGERRRAEDDDAVLLERFAGGGDAAAFDALLERYGAMVYQVCRRALPTEQDAEDAFQATFLVLVQRAGAIRRRERLAGWLHQTAVRVSGKVRLRSRRRAAREARCARPEAVADAEPAQAAEAHAVLDEELNRLPDKYRRPVILSVFEEVAAAR